jgi:hypothetical protein
MPALPPADFRVAGVSPKKVEISCWPAGTSGKVTSSFFCNTKKLEIGTHRVFSCFSPTD